jgi:hypothetical protein
MAPPLLKNPGPMYWLPLWKKATVSAAPSDKLPSNTPDRICA